MSRRVDSVIDPQVILRSIRLMSEAFFAFDAMNRTRLKGFELTPAQFDIIATLGNTCGMTFSELGHKTLITKGTLTGVVDRLVRMGLVERQTGQRDRRTIVVRLTAKGNAMFRRAHPELLSQLSELFEQAGYKRADFAVLDRQFARLRDCFDQRERPESTTTVPAPAEESTT